LAGCGRATRLELFGFSATDHMFGDDIDEGDDVFYSDLYTNDYEFLL
jgi:hypothetical protein